jgi:hypothetical protein
MMYKTGSYDLESGQKIKEKVNALAFVVGFIIFPIVSATDNESRRRRKAGHI